MFRFWRRKPTKLLDRLIEGLIRPEHPKPPARRDNPDAVVDCAVYAHGARRPGRVHYADAARHVRRHQD